ncbi:uncharacterized protein MEPE_02239 [Melanopsichium pennsylvanicum]|uniref:Uncharacterized protein n=2 Tax=Melanopsichium pennsylvanicum TaxID=63383 RepID=A0AAJ4XKB0_9BASI|nr:conserved hypothetical protein [Melanopsichium pennsylvanicum 4]SNX83532.1 uncharacterized protein MEPE_02239 [Melanopsichium pennsylvanicum]
MTSMVAASKKRNSFSLLTRKDLFPTSEEETELANSRFIPESKRGWRYDTPCSQAAPATVDLSIASATGSNTAPKSSKSRSARLETTGSGTLQVEASHQINRPYISGVQAALSAPASPKSRVNALNSIAPDVASSESSSSSDEPGLSALDESISQSSSPGVTFATKIDGTEVDVKHHPDDLTFPEAYPWKPSQKNPKARFINPAHRNPTAKQAFYDTHFGSSSNYRGLLPASGSLLSSSLNKIDARRRSSEKSGKAADVEEEQQSAGLVSTMKKPFTTASKYLTKARRKSMAPGPQPSEAAANRNVSEKPPATIGPTHPKRPHPVPTYNGVGDNLAAQRSGFSYGMSLEDAAQVEAVVSRHASQEDLGTVVQQDLLHSPGHEVSSSSRWREAMQSVWGFLPSVDFFASPSAPTDHTRAVTSGNILEPEAIPSVIKDSGNPDYFKNLSGNVVIMGGYRGSVLRDAETNMMMWIPIKVGVGLRRPTLELGLSTAAEENSEDLVYSSDMCTHIGKLVDMGQRLEQKIAARRHARAYTWGYDWRLSLARSSKRLVDFLEKLYEASADEATGNKRGAKVVAHSMGGLVALHALATCTNPRIFEGLVFASTPFRGTPNILGPFRFGDAALLNDTICSPRATFSFRSSFYLLPTDKRCFEIPVGDPDQDEEDLTEQQKRERFRDVDFLDPDVWNELGLSPCLEVGRRQQLIAIARKTPSTSQRKQSAMESSNKAELEEEASQAVAKTYSTSASQDLDTVSPSAEESNNPNGLTMGLMEGLTDNKNPAVGQTDASPEEQAQLQPENRQGASRNNDDEAEFDKFDYPTQSWLYLDRTLAEVRRFWADIEQGFDRSKADAGLYPPIMLIVSGRTPCVRGALIGVDEAYSSAPETETARKGWKDDVRAGDYSRMTYGAGDGVITRRSATSLPGKWSTLLTTRAEAESLPEEMWGKGPPFPTKPKKLPGKGRLKLDKYKMRFDGRGIVESAHRHVTLLSDVDGIGKCLEAVRRANLKRGRVPLASH